MHSPSDIWSTMEQKLTVCGNYSEYKVVHCRITVTHFKFKTAFVSVLALLNYFFFNCTCSFFIYIMCKSMLLFFVFVFFIRALWSRQLPLMIYLID